MIVRELNEDVRRELARTFVGAGWKYLKEDLEKRKAVLINRLVYGTDRSSDADCRAMVNAINMLLNVEKEIFLPTPPPEQEAFTIPNVNRYGNSV